MAIGAGISASAGTVPVTIPDSGKKLHGHAVRAHHASDTL